MLKRLLLLVLCMSYLTLQAQSNGTIAGIVIDKTSQKPLSGAIISLGKLSAISDSLGRFSLKGIDPGSYNISISLISYATLTKFNVSVTSGNENVLNVELEPLVKELGNVTIKSNRRTVKAATLETPLSVQRLTTEEIKNSPGSNFDISRVIQTLPGVGGTAGSTAGFRNDIIIRGGAPNENVYYLDGIEVPVINHFTTQGSAGGPTGILNVSFIEDVKLSTSAFDAKYDNTLSSVFEFKQKRGNTERVQGNVRLSATELAATFDGPLSNNGKTTFLASARRSYLQFLFKLIDLPIRPNYWDFQYKITHQFDKKTTLTFLGVGAIDQFSFAAPKNATPEKLYALNANPSINQWSYTVGASLKRLMRNGYWNLSISRNALNNNNQKYQNNLGPDKGVLTLNVDSRETENKLRLDVNQVFGNWKISHGADLQYVEYFNNTYQLIRPEIKDNTGNVTQQAITALYGTNVNFVKAGAFLQAGKRFFNNRLGVSAGIRSDVNSFTMNGGNPFKTISPRISFSYVLADKWNLNATIGNYYKLPPYTVLGFQSNGLYTNQQADYTQCTHYVAGIEHLRSEATRFTFEVFYKKYNHVPISIIDGISLSNLGGDFNILGNEPVSFFGKGKSYGFEFFAQQKLTKRFYGVFSYTFFRSEYTNANNLYAPSSWDNRHLLSFTWGYKFNHNWELGLKFRYQGGVPYTPYDDNLSRQNFLTLGTGIFDYSKINTLRLGAFNSSDMRIDKKWNYRRATLDLYLDVMNWYAAKAVVTPAYTFKRNADNTAFLTTDGQPIKPDGSNAIPYLLTAGDAIVTPTIGFIVEF
ncbi:MAG: TonB-dependent receptor [Bacteroidota bacterium]|nr:TonB-dependent receptor [Bacteroidota bacterium]